MYAAADYKLKRFIYLFIMHKVELVAAIAAEAGLTKVDAQKALEAGVKAISEALVKGENVQLIGFGTFAVVERAERNGVNPSRLMLRKSLSSRLVRRLLKNSNQFGAQKERLPS